VEVQTLGRCQTHYLTTSEAFALTHLNSSQLKYDFGDEPFSTSDIVVEFAEFKAFFEMVTDTVRCKVASDLGFTEGGWLQINNTVSGGLCETC